MVERANAAHPHVSGGEQSLFAVLNQTLGITLHASHAYSLTDVSSFHFRENVFLPPAM